MSRRSDGSLRGSDPGNSVRQLLNVFEAIQRLRQNPNTQHLPVIGILSDKANQLQESAVSAGVTLVVNDLAILNHLPQFLDQALQVD